MTGHKRTSGKQHNKWRIFGIWLIVLVLLVVSIISAVAERRKRIFTIGSEKVYIDEVSFYALQCAFQYHLSNVDMLYEYYDGVTTYEERYKSEVRNTLIDTKVMYLYALRQGITLTKKDQSEITQNVANTLSDIGDYLDKFHINEALVTKILTQQQYAKALRSSVLQENDEKKTYFHTYNLLFPSVKTDADGTLRTNADGSIVPANEADKQKQYELAMKALELSKSGESLEEIAKQCNVTATSGDLYGDMEQYDSQKYLDAIADMDEGEVSGIVETIYGYNVFRLISKDDPEYAADMDSQQSAFTASLAYESQLEKWKQAAGLDEQKVDGKAWSTFTMKDYIIKR